MQLEQELKEKTADIEKLLERMLPEEAGLQKTIFSAMRYSLMAGGKRIRPLLIAETYRFSAVRIWHWQSLLWQLLR